MTVLYFLVKVGSRRVAFKFTRLKDDVITSSLSQLEIIDDPLFLLPHHVWSILPIYQAAYQFFSTFRDRYAISII